MALRRLSLRFPERVPQYLEITKSDVGIGNEVRVTWHELSAGLGNRSSMQTLTEMCGPSYEFRTRINAFDAVKQLNYLDTTVALNLLDAMLSSNSRLRGPASDTIQYFSQQMVHRKTLERAYASVSWLPWQKELLAPVMQLK
jgi:hypothetical protein